MIKRLFNLLVVAVVLLGITVFWGWRQLNDPIVIGPDQQFEIPSGASFASVAERLAQRDLVMSALFMKIYGRLSNKASQLKAGEYELPLAASTVDLVQQFIEGDVIEYSVTLVEGKTFAEWLVTLADHPKIESTLLGIQPTKAMLRISGESMYPEGWFHPDTYHFHRGTQDVDILKRAHHAMQQALQEEWANREDNLPIETPYEALILASIVEKETGLASERGEIAGVFVRRLKKRMRLQTDPTVIYGLGPDYDGNITRKDLRTDTPYNTYTRRGLPPTPIAMPSRDAIHAALNPKPGETLYFVAKGDGSHRFSKTLDEHNKAVREYQWKRREDYRSAPSKEQSEPATAQESP